MSFNVNIPCPLCKTSIPADTEKLLLGFSFSCPNCAASIGLPSESKEVVGNAISQLDVLKKKNLSK